MCSMGVLYALYEANCFIDGGNKEERLEWGAVLNRINATFCYEAFVFLQSSAGQRFLCFGGLF